MPLVLRSLAFTGCLDSAKRVDGYLQFNVIDDLIEEPGRTVQVPIITVDASYDNKTPLAVARLDEEWADDFRRHERWSSPMRFTTRALTSSISCTRGRND